MACQVVIYDPDAKSRKTYTCDEANAERVVSDDHAAKGKGEYTDTAGKKFSFDWTKARLVAFNRKP